MKYLDAALPSPAENLALDEALLDAVEVGECPAVLRTWVPTSTFVVVGYANRIADEVHADRCHQDNIPILRRCSGGGTVVQMPGCLNYALVLPIGEHPDLATISSTNQWVMTRVRDALRNRLRIPVSIRGTTDLALDRRKCSGNAQRRKRNAVLFHGTFLLKANLQTIADLLPFPTKQPDYREDRSHLDFLRNLDIHPLQLIQSLQEEWQAHDPFPALPQRRLDQLVIDRYALPSWHAKF